MLSEENVIFPFTKGDVVLAQCGSHLYYAKVLSIDYKQKFANLLFEDDSQEDVSFKNIFSVNEETSEIICVMCRDDEADLHNDIVLCDKCNVGYHQLCHDPPIAPEVLIPEIPWQCKYCRKNEMNPFIPQNPFAIKKFKHYIEQINGVNFVLLEPKVIVEKFDISQFHESNSSKENRNKDIMNDSKGHINSTDIKLEKELISHLNADIKDEKGKELTMTLNRNTSNQLSDKSKFGDIRRTSLSKSPFKNILETRNSMGDGFSELENEKEREEQLGLQLDFEKNFWSSNKEDFSTDDYSEKRQENQVLSKDYWRGARVFDEPKFTPNIVRNFNDTIENPKECIKISHREIFHENRQSRLQCDKFSTSKLNKQSSCNVRKEQRTQTSIQNLMRKNVQSETVIQTPKSNVENRGIKRSLDEITIPEFTKTTIKKTKRNKIPVEDKVSENVASSWIERKLKRSHQSSMPKKDNILLRRPHTQENHLRSGITGILQSLNTTPYNVSTSSDNSKIVNIPYKTSYTVCNNDNNILLRVPQQRQETNLFVVRREADELMNNKGKQLLHKNNNLDLLQHNAIYTNRMHQRRNHTVSSLSASTQSLLTYPYRQYNQCVLHPTNHSVKTRTQLHPLLNQQSCSNPWTPYSTRPCNNWSVVKINGKLYQVTHRKPGKDGTSDYTVVPESEYTTLRVNKYICNQCNNEAAFICSACQNSWYCSRHCQIKDWQHHYRMCGNSR